MMLVLLLMAATEPSAGCTTKPLDLEIVDYLAFGDVVDQALQHCATVNFPDMRRVPGRSYVLGRTKLLRFRLLGERFGLNLNLVTQPVDALALPGSLAADRLGANVAGPDRLFVVPSLVLPPSWQEALDETVDTLAAPVALAGGIALTTAVLVKILKK
ncbi:MAG: hypothetical protein AAF654_14220 [Myxococcota bacterium]